MLKRIALLFLAFALCIIAVSCTEEGGNQSVVSSDTSKDTSVDTNNDISETVSVPSDKKDTIPPAFVDAVDGALPSVSHNVGEETDLLSGIIARDNITADADIVITVTDDGGYNKDIAGTYTLTLQAQDEDGNLSTVTLEVTVKEIVAQSVITFSGNYAVNSTDALSYTTSGTKFRTSDVIQIMDLDTFTAQYNAYSADHTNNGNVPFFPNGVIVITDEDYNIVQVRIAAGENIQIDADGSVKNSGFAWTNTIDASNGGGMFKGILKDLDTLIPDGGHIMFVGNPGEQTCRVFLIQQLFFSGYESGAVTLDLCDIDISNTTISLE